MKHRLKLRGLVGGFPEVFYRSSRELSAAFFLSIGFWGTQGYTTALYEAAGAGHEGVVALLFASPRFVSASARGWKSYTALHAAADQGSLKSKRGRREWGRQIQHLWDLKGTCPQGALECY